MYGFKSFADRTRVEFSEGITALLGPNGCGKSNVVDAIKWVLGEQASRAMRAEKMEDVIFNGTETRKSLAVAEVSLSLSNEGGVLPLDMPEITIRRRLHRSGESEYYLNDAQVKLREIRRIFWDTGVGKAAYSVMEQGKIDQILSSKPDERRYLFEEAAGITKFKIKSAEAERKLAKTEENMRQVFGILGEVKRAYDNLKAQADKTLKYRSLRDAVFYLELDMHLIRLKTFYTEREAVSQALEQKTAERDRLKTELDEMGASLESAMDEVNALEKKIGDSGLRLQSLMVERAAKTREVKALTEQRVETKSAVEQHEIRELAVRAKIEDLAADAEEQEYEVRNLEKSVRDSTERGRSFEEHIKTAAKMMEDNEAAETQADEEVRAFERERAAYERDLEDMTDRIVAALDAGLKEAGYEAADRRNTEDAIREGLNRLSALLEAATDAPEPRRAAVVREAAGYAARVTALFADYRAGAPDFIDEFLAPEGIITQKRALDAKVRGATDGAARRRDIITGLRQDNQGMRHKIDEYRKTLEELRVQKVRMATQAQAAAEKSKLIRRELAGQEALLQSLGDDLFLSRRRVAELDEEIIDTEEEAGSLEQEGRVLAEEIERLNGEIQSRNSRMAGTREQVKRHSASLGAAQERLEGLHLELARSEIEIRSIQDTFRETHSRDLAEFADRMAALTAPAGELRERLAAAKAELKALGQVNFMAPEECAETKTRYDFLAGQLADLTQARDDLANLAAAIRDEASRLFLDTYHKVRKHFHEMFRRLFGGGRAEIRLVDTSRVLESGIEIFAQPPGKKLETINLLSGGERSMTAVALLFATYLVKPSPFCFLDEIDAALDEANVSRFVQVLREFGAASQFIIITHNKKTVIGADTLLGVTMEESGVTKMISVRLSPQPPAVP
jgi:chromosome segregation protein